MLTVGAAVSSTCNNVNSSYAEKETYIEHFLSCFTLFLDFVRVWFEGTMKREFVLSDNEASRDREYGLILIT